MSERVVRCAIYTRSLNVTSAGARLHIIGKSQEWIEILFASAPHPQPLLVGRCFSLG
jgi:hypothetical protein